MLTLVLFHENFMKFPMKIIYAAHSFISIDYFTWTNQLHWVMEGQRCELCGAGSLNGKILGCAQCSRRCCLSCPLRCWRCSAILCPECRPRRKDLEFRCTSCLITSCSHGTSEESRCPCGSHMKLYPKRRNWSSESEELSEEAESPVSPQSNSYS